jgi:LysR family hydrogen peroxide-inducible transcriptional activator
MSVSVHLPSLRQLRYFIALDEHRHFGRAAAACFVTQSTLSAGIADLERLLGVQLVERSKRTVRLTDSGAALVERARNLVRDAAEFAEAAQTRTAPLSGTLRLAVIPTIAPFVLPTLLPAVARDWPLLKLAVRETPSPTACDGIARGTADCALLALPFPCGDVETAVVGSDALMLALPGGEAHGPVAAADIDPARLLLLEDGHCLKDHALAACGQPAMNADARMIGTSLHTLVQMVAGGLGVTLLPEMAVRAGILDRTGAEAVSITGDDATRRIALAWRRGNARAPEFRMFAGTIASCLA